MTYRRDDDDARRREEELRRFFERVFNNLFKGFGGMKVEDSMVLPVEGEESDLFYDLIEKENGYDLLIQLCGWIENKELDFELIDGRLYIFIDDRKIIIDFPEKFSGEIESEGENNGVLLVELRE